MKLSTFLTATIMSAIQGTEAIDDAPSLCDHVRNLGGCGGFGRDDAICANGSGGWKFGINSGGTLGLWKPNGALVRAFASNRDDFWLEDDDAKYIYSDSYSDDDDDQWLVFCREGLPIDSIDLVVDPKSDDVVRFGGLPPYDRLMVINKKGEMTIDERCELNSKETAPPATCAYVKSMEDSDGFQRDEALCGNKNSGGWKFGINSAGTLGLWKPNGSLVQTFATEQDEFYLEDDDDKWIQSFYYDEDGEWTGGWGVYCEESVETQGVKLVLNPSPDHDNIIKFKVPGIKKYSRLATINKKGEVKVDQKLCVLE